jgi:hypothetical protein
MRDSRIDETSEAAGFAVAYERETTEDVLLATRRARVEFLMAIRCIGEEEERE